MIAPHLGGEQNSAYDTVEDHETGSSLRDTHYVVLD